MGYTVHYLLMSYLWLLSQDQKVKLLAYILLMYLIVLAVVDITQELIDESQQMICESTITRIIFEFNITYVFIVSWLGHFRASILPW